MLQSETDRLLYILMRSDQPQDVQKGTQLLTKMAKPIAMRIVLSNSGSEADAKDILQESLISLWSQIRSGAYTYQPGTPLANYVSSIIRNKWYKELRKRRMKNEETLPETDLPDVEIEGENYLNQLENALDQLDEPCRKILTLYYLERLSLSDIA